MTRAESRIIVMQLRVPHLLIFLKQLRLQHSVEAATAPEAKKNVSLAPIPPQPCQILKKIKIKIIFKKCL